MSRILRATFLLLMLTQAAFAGEPFRLQGTVRLRGEQWSWFETPGYEDSYRFLGALLRAGVAHRVSPTLDGQVELAVPLLAGLPDRAVAPAPAGQLGFGGTYYAANGDSTATSLFAKQAWLRLSSGRASLRLGRFEWTDGAEINPKNATLAELKRTRIAHRLIGSFGFTHVGRSVDGIQATWQKSPQLHFLAIAARPTTGAFEVDGGGSLEIDLLYGAATRTTDTSDSRLFALFYRDGRDVLKTDNRPLEVRRADAGRIEINTIGGHFIRTMPAHGGTMDLVAWGALQGGQWGALDHRAYAGDVELGWRRGTASIRGGTSIGSGDGDPADGDHRTFFQVLPTPRLHARFPFYNAMNSRDVFAIASWKPLPKLTLQSELHRLSLTNARDLWYSGGGAFDERSFGFAGRPSNGQSHVANVADLSADYTLNEKTSLGAYAAFARGGAVVDRIFAGRNASLFYVEVTRRF